MFLIIDNYDSFTYNLYQMISEDVIVVKNDQITVDEIAQLSPDGIIISPGPGRPPKNLIEIIHAFKGKVPILGVCLGHQAIGEAFGAEVKRASAIFHGKDSLIFHSEKDLFEEMPRPFRAGRYHSLVVEKIPEELIVDAETEDGVVMGFHHRDYPIYGIQFHPESVLTPDGKTMIQNFLRVCLLHLVKKMRGKMKPLNLDTPILDIVGTGGDMAGTINISTGSALLAARCGAKVLKHGNRAITSKCGSADVLEALGYDIHQDPVQALLKNHFGFCFAPDYHPDIKRAKEKRIARKKPTLFNLVGPLLNPAGTDHLQIGVYKPEYVPMIAEALFKLGTKRSLVYSGHGIDELSCIGKTEAILVTDKGCEKITIDPAQLGLDSCNAKDLLGGNAELNAELLKNPTKAIRDTLILNAGVGLFLYGIASTILEGVQIAKRKALFPKGSIIAEVKKASPSKGKIADIPDVAKRARVYEKSGAAAISVLTNEKFSGSLEDLHQVRQSVSIPVLRKDFILTEEDLAKTKSDLVLLIVSYLKEDTKKMLEAALALNLEAIVEVHNKDELKIALDAGAKIIGVNQRNLKDFTMHPESFELVRGIPDHIVKIAESGVSSGAQAKRLFDMGYDAILVGEALSKRPEICEELCSLKSVV